MDETEISAQLGDAEALRRVLADLEDRSRSFGSALTGALRSATAGGKGLDDVLKGLALRMSSIALSAGLKPLENLLGGAVGSVLGGAGSLFGFAEGGIPGRVTPFAAGGVVAAPTYFSLGRDTGLMGEAGAEAILPLARGSDGSLGVAASGSGGGTQIVFNVTTPDAGSFRKSEGQISAMLARSVRRGQRAL